MNRAYVQHAAKWLVPFTAVALLVGCNSGDDDNDNTGAGAQGVAVVSSMASESGTIQISKDDTRVFVVNRGVAGSGSLSVIQVKDVTSGADTAVVLAELPVGNDPQSVSVDPTTTRAYVSNGADGTVTVIDLVENEVLTTISVGSEPRGTALSPTGATLYVANYSDGTLSVIDTASNTVDRTIDLVSIRNPFAVTVTSDGDTEDSDEIIYVADFFAQARPGKGVDEVEGRNDGKEGRVIALDADTLDPVQTIALSPMASGFAADRTAFDTANGAVNDTFKSSSADPTKDPQSAYFNQLHAVSIDDQTGKLFVNAVGASPEPPVKFNVNVQAMVGVIDGQSLTEIPGEHTNLNNLIKVETQPAEPFNGSLVRAFAADTIDTCIRQGTVLMISRAGSYALKASFDGQGKLSLNNDAQTPAVRIPTGSIPSGVIMSSDGKRAYVNAEVDQTVTAIDLEQDAVIGNAIASSELPAPGSVEHNALIGKLVFFTGMGVQPEGIVGGDVRAMDTHQFRGLASDNNWSSCASCHPSGLSDNVTWIFPTGPRQTPPLDASYSPADPQVQRVFNWNAVRGSITDFNNNSRNIQGGKGFTPQGDADAGLVFNHGPNEGISDALDLNTLWVQIGIRTPNGPSTTQGSVTAGRTAFEALNCNACHGGDQWTSSKVNWDYPLFPSNPLAPGGAVPFDPRVQNLGTGPVILAFDVDANGIFDEDGNGFVDDPIVARFDVGAVPASPTLDLTNPIEIRGAGGAIGKGSVGGAGSFNPPSLLGLRNSAPYGHHGRAQNVTDVFKPIAEGGVGHPTFGASSQQLTDLEAFLLSIDGATTPID